MQCCKRCESTGVADACIEMVEIRILPQFVPLKPDGKVFRPRFNGSGVDMFLWIDEEKELRRQGKVIWRPLNLIFGDAATKAKLMTKFEAGGAGGFTRLAVDFEESQRNGFDHDVKVWKKAQRMMRRNVERWTHEEAELAMARLGQKDHIQTSQPEIHSEKNVIQLGGAQDDKENQQPCKQRQDTEKQRSKWETEFLDAKQELYEQNMRAFGRTEADETEERWVEDMPKMMRGIRDFFEQKCSFLERGRNEEYACWESARFLTLPTRNLIEDFIPGMLLPVELEKSHETCHS